MKLGDMSGEITLSVEIAKKMLYRLELLEKINKPERERILHVMDSLLRDAQTTLTHQKLA